MNLEKMFRKIYIILFSSFHFICKAVDIEESNMRIIEVIIKNEHYKVELEDNKSADIFLERLPLKIKVKELNGNEKYGIISKKIPSDRSYSGNIEVGDLMLYGDDCIVLFYGSLSNGVGKKQINFYIAPVENHWSYFVTNNLLVIKILALK